MNEDLQKYARGKLKEDLAKCTDKEIYTFKRMYSKQPAETDINEVVDNMFSGKLDWAMQQVQRTLDAKEINQPNN